MKMLFSGEDREVFEQQDLQLNCLQALLLLNT